MWSTLYSNLYLFINIGGGLWLGESYILPNIQSGKPHAGRESRRTSRRPNQWRSAPWREKSRENDHYVIKLGNHNWM